MAYIGEFKVYEDIIQEMSVVYQHDKRPWMIGFSGGKDSTLLCCLVMEMLQRLPVEKRNNIPVVTDSKNTILWLPGLKKSKFDMETDQIYDIILLYEEE